MKTKFILFIGISAIVTLSFTFASVSATTKEAPVKNEAKTNTEPIGGFLSEDEL